MALKTQCALGLLVCLISLWSVYALQDTCDFEQGICSDYKTKNCSVEPCFKVTTADQSEYGPTLDHNPGTGRGSYAYAYSKKTGLATLHRSVMGPFCFTGWYHASGVQHPNAYFRSDLAGSYFVIFHSVTMDFTGAWRKVVYSEKRKGTVKITIAALIDGRGESASFAVDDLTFKSGICDPAPRDGSCDFDWGDTCGYSVGNRTGQWRLSDWGNGARFLRDVSTGSLGGYVHHWAPEGKKSSAVLSSPKLNGGTATQCLHFHYYFPPYIQSRSFGFSLKVSLSGSSGAPLVLWERSRDSVVNGRWTPAQVSFNTSSSFQLNFECSVDSGPHKEFYCAVDAVRLTQCERSKGNDNHDCDFEHGFCTWQNVDEIFGSRSEWIMGGGTTKTTLPRPSKDHTLANSTGSYIYFSSYQQVRGTAARLVSEPVAPRGPAEQCMEFWYIVAGEKAAKLRVQSIPVYSDPKDTMQQTLLWEAEGGEFDTWQLGRIAVTEKTRLVFEGIAAGAAPPGYVALDDISIFANESCDTAPPGNPLNNDVEGLLNCNFGGRSLCRWSFPAKRKDVGWLFSDLFSPKLNIGPRALPAGLRGSYIYTNRAMMSKNGGDMKLVSTTVPSQRQLWCATVWYHMFGGSESSLDVSMRSLVGNIGGSDVWSSSEIFVRKGRTNVDRWYSIKRTLDMSGPANQLVIRFTNRKFFPSEVAIGPIYVTTGVCRSLTYSLGWCDFEYSTCEWTSNKPSRGWKLQTDGTGAISRSGPSDTYFFLQLRGGVGANDSTLSSPWFQGKKQPQCLQFWYRRDALATGSILVDVKTGGVDQPTTVWRQPPYPMKDWMLARVPIVQEKQFQVVFRGIFTNRRDTLAALGLDDVEILPEQCKSLFECAFEDDLCGYVNDYTDDLRWLVGTGRVVKPGLPPALPRPPSSSPTPSDDGKSSWTRFAYVDLTASTWNALRRGTTQDADQTPARLISPVFDVADKGNTVQLTYFRKGRDIVSMELSQVAYQDDSGNATNLQTVQLAATQGWQSTSLTLKPSKQSQLVIAMRRGPSTDGMAAIGIISSGGSDSAPANESSLSCDFEKGTFCGWENDPTFPFKLNDPANKVPAFPKSDHTLRAYRGRFMYVESPTLFQAKLRSPEIPEEVRNGFCLSLWHLSVHNKNGYLVINDTVKIYVVSRDNSTYSHHWAHSLFQMKMPQKANRLTVYSLVQKGLTAVDDLEITPGLCPQRGKCTFEDGSPCNVYTSSGSKRPWVIASGRVLNIPDHTLQSTIGNYLYVNTTNVDPSHPEARVFFGDRKPTPATCLTFWWKGFGVPSNLNVYLHTKETVLRDPILSLSTRPTPRWWNVRYVTISSRLTWKLVFEALSVISSRQQSGVIIDDVEFTEGECPSEKLCNFEDDICVPWAQVVLTNSSGLNNGFKVQRADQSDTLKKDHTLSSGEGYYLMFHSTGNILDSVSLELREPRFQCASFWYYISKSSDGCDIEVDDKIINSYTTGWKRLQFGLNVAGGQSIIFYSGGDDDAFVAIDDIMVDERKCEDMGSPVVDNFKCGDGSTVTANKVCDFVKDCKDGSDEVDCGACDFSNGTCGWDGTSQGKKGYTTWERRRVGEAIGSPRLNSDGNTNGYYMLLQERTHTQDLIARAILSAPTIRNTNHLCVVSFWYNYGTKNNTIFLDLEMEVNGNKIDLWNLRAAWTVPPERLWRQTRVLLGRYAGEVKLFFSGFEVPANQGYFAIDEISFANCGLPQKAPSCKDPLFKCANGACITPYDVCNYVDNCGDGSDEVNCGDHNSGCNFDTSFCDWKPVASTGSALSGWVRRKPRNFRPIQPTRDHTTGLQEGQFLQLSTSGSRNVDAEIAGPLFQASSSCMITFFYTIYGDAPTTLTFGIRNTTGGPLQSVWTSSLPTGFFHFIEVFLPFVVETPFQVFFRGTLGYTITTSYIAIDDVSFTKECRPYHGTLPAPSVKPAPIGPPLCPKGQFTCIASRQCIPQSQVCDFKEHCSDGSDEKLCGACDFSFDLCGLTTDNPSAKFTWSRISAEKVARNPSANYGLPTKDSQNNPNGYYCAFKLTNQDVPRGDPNALLTPPLGQVAHSCTVSFYTYLTAPSLSLWFGVQNNGTSGAPARRRRFAVLKGFESKQRWTKMSVRVGNWNPGARFYFMSDQKHASIDGIQYRSCHPDKDSDSYEASLLVSCTFANYSSCGWFPENLEDDLDWVRFGYGKVTHRWQPPFVDVGHSGSYMFATNLLSTEARAHLVSKRVDATDSKGRCFSFWYSMRHPNSGTLNLLLRSEDNSTNLLWTRSGPQGRAWARGHVEFFADTVHKFVLEAILLGSTPAVIAVDNIFVTTGECKGKALSCDFEYNKCGWSANGWEMNTGLRIGTPHIDHTTETGYGVYARLTRTGGHLWSPALRMRSSKERRCVKFWFYLSGTDSEQLNVTRVLDFVKDYNIWSVRASQVPQKQWLSGSVDVLGYSGPVMVAFIGATSGDSETAVAVDDILIDGASCPTPGSCDFEDDFCNWRNVGNKTSTMQWYRNSGPTMTRDGPSVDHTLKTVKGSYLLLDAQDLSTVQQGIVESEIIAKASDVCFQLFYQIANRSDASFAVEVRDESGSTVNKWKVMGGGNNAWKSFVRDLTNLPSFFTIRITGTPGKQLRSDIAIDDITLVNGKCSGEPVTTTSASLPSSESTTVEVLTSQPSTKSEATTSAAESSTEALTTTPEPTTKPAEVLTCGPGQFSCRDNEHCIPLALLCDGVKDCPNGIDEKCGGRNQCKQGFAFCPRGTPESCIPRQYLCDDHEDCSDGSDESLCGYCPSYYCRNGGHCNVLSDNGRPTCTCPEGTFGERCELSAPTADELQLHSAAANGWAIAIPVILILVAVGTIGFLLYRRRKILNSPVFLNNPTYDASTDEARILN